MRVSLTTRHDACPARERETIPVHDSFGQPILLKGLE